MAEIFKTNPLLCISTSLIGLDSKFLILYFSGQKVPGYFSRAFLLSFSSLCFFMYYIMLRASLSRNLKIKSWGKYSLTQSTIPAIAKLYHLDVTKRLNTTKVIKPLEGIRVLELGQVNDMHNFFPAEKNLTSLKYY